MSLVSVYSALELPAFSPHPSVTCLQWTAEGQLLYLSKNAVFILTPALGINADTSSAVKTCPTKGNTAMRPLAWLKTVIEPDKRALYYHWPVDSQEWGTASLGSLDLSLRAVTSSPSLWASEKGCVIAVITSNLQLSLWIAPKGHLKGQWTLLGEVTELLKDIAAEAADSPVERTLRSQVGCCAWSAQPNFAHDPPPPYDGSVLALGSRAGTVVFLRLDDGVASALHHLQTVKVSEHWITHIAWSPWRALGSDKCQATIACGAADGSVFLLDVLQILMVDPGLSIGCKCSLRWECVPVCVAHPADQKTITGLQWIPLPSKPPVLVHCKPGLVYVWFPSPGPESPATEYVFRLQTQKTSVSSSFLRPVSGVVYVEKYDMLVLSLYDGTFHAVYNLSTGPSIAPPSDAHPTSAGLSSMSRTVFLRCEERPVRRAEMCSINGMQLYSGEKTFVWVHETSCPSDFSYKYDAQHISTIVVADLWPGSDDDSVIHEIQNVLIRTKSTCGHSPLSIMRPVLFQLLLSDALDTLFPRILGMLNVQDVELPALTLSPVHDMSDTLPSEMRESLGRHLLGSQQLFALRLRLFLADFCWKHAPSAEMQGECGVVAQAVLRSVSRFTLRILLDHLAAVCDVLAPDDLPFVFRVIVQCLLPDAPPTLLAAAQLLSTRISERLRSDAGHAGVQTDELTESCPACGLAVPLDDMTSAICPAGHTWSRCSITSFILSTPMIRTCVGCKRKAFLPSVEPSDAVAVDGGEHLPSGARSWVVRELLHAVRRCLFCGNGFMSLI
ncbi:putative zinc-finger of transcription factor IIIC complex-domain-containing protein [Vararia minispora EC-137]|uniref:Zinc-finger of transcription factor IIIC complex-domain-containing protein n=1 Tax=Vararia minispora EC-137 TaxID=1314806 RepID=A0ACB8QE37_9AGAM|nr:putative zinc-finger of transcription factor IIIC complex-domain-containing protein [Vararia minispora EC-137]